MEWKKTVKIIGIAIGVYVMLKYMLPVVIPFLFGWLLAYWIYPLVLKIEKKIKVKRGLIAGVLLGILIMLLSLLFFWLGKILFQQIRGAITNFDVIKQTVSEFADGCCASVEKLTGIARGDSKIFLMKYVTNLQGEIGERLPAKMLQYTISSVKQLIIFFSAIIIIYIAGVLFVKDMEKIQKTIQSKVILKRISNVGGRLGSAGGAYFRAQFIIMGIVAVVCTVGFYFLGNKYFLLVGILIGLLDALPLIGTGTILIPWAILCLVQGNFMRAAAYVGIYVITDLIRQFMEPKLIGEKLGVYPIMILFSVYVGLFLYGVLGFILGPITLLLIKEIYAEISVEKVL